MSLQTLAFLTWSEFCENLKEMNPYVLWGAAAAIVLAVCFMVFANKKSGGFHWDTRLLTLGAICVALGYILSFIKLYELPFGGSITAASMLPLLAYGYMAGPLWGTIAGFVYFLLQLTQGLYFLTPLQFALDYVVPFIVLGTLSGVFKTKNTAFNLYGGFALAVVARYLCHFVAGFVFWGEYAADYGFNSPVLYSLVYNSFVLVDAIPCFILISIPAIKKLFRRLPKKQKIENAEA